jgi:two-component system, OmpR family, response regulator
MSKEFTSLAVLVIDDELLIRWALSAALSEAGHAVVDAPDGSGGLRAVMTAPQAFDVVFLDFRLPDSSDFTLLTAIRTWAPRSAVVLMTASGTPEMVAEAYRLGVYRVLNKPFDLVEVHNVVAAVSGASRTLGGNFHGSTRHQCVPVSVPMDFNRLRNETGTVDLRDLPALR